MIKRILRIIIGLILSPVLFVVSGWVWLNISKKDELYCWDYIWFTVSGDWDKLPD